MKQIIILILVIIAFIIGFGKYNEYQRFNSNAIAYKTPKNIDFNYHNKTTVLNYHKAIEDLNSFIMLQWTVNNIDVRTPEDDDEQTQSAVKKHANKLATVKFYEKNLQNSFQLKKEGHTNNSIKNIEFSGKSAKEFKKDSNKKIITQLFKTSKKVEFGQGSAIVFEVQKILAQKGFKIKVDGLYREETSNAIKKFEVDSNLFADGKLDLLTLVALLENR